MLSYALRSILRLATRRPRNRNPSSSTMLDVDGRRKLACLLKEPLYPQNLFLDVSRRGAWPCCCCCGSICGVALRAVRAHLTRACLRWHHPPRLQALSVGCVSNAVVGGQQRRDALQFFLHSVSVCVALRD
eukprot:6185861-Pleurochrysis_carterae.AAC.3